MPSTALPLPGHPAIMSLLKGEHGEVHRLTVRFFMGKRDITHTIYVNDDRVEHLSVFSWTAVLHANWALVYALFTAAGGGKEQLTASGCTYVLKNPTDTQRGIIASAITHITDYRELKISTTERMKPDVIDYDVHSDITEVEHKKITEGNWGAFVGPEAGPNITTSDPDHDSQCNCPVCVEDRRGVVIASNHLTPRPVHCTECTCDHEPDTMCACDHAPGGK